MKEKMFAKVKTGAVAANKHLCRTFGPGVALCCCGCMLYVHRNAIKSAIKGEELPAAPSWHFWVKNRKTA